MNKIADLAFKPGAGEIPPVLAGRENEKATIMAALEDLGAGSSPAADIALIGPRGNGKTALLRWVEAQVRGCNNNIKCVALNPDDFKTHSGLVGMLADQGALAALVGDRFSATVQLLGSGVGFSRQEAAQKLLRPVLEKRCSKNGLVILIDEAQTLARYPDSARAFFNDVQAVVGNGRPLLLILAGTPNIVTRLAALEATFWNRLNKIGIGLLDAAAAREALRIPLDRMGYGIEAGTLDEAANEAQCYPYFIQVVGDALHAAAKREPDKLVDGNGIGEAILKQARSAFSLTMNSYFADRYQELRASGILPAADAVARLFVSRKKESIFAVEFEDAVSRSVDADANMKERAEAESKAGSDPAFWVEQELRHVGFVWSRIGHEDMCEPGIPSLMDYVIKRVDQRELIRNPE